MPELPEVETICRGLSPLIIGATITKVVVRENRLRLLIPANLPSVLNNREIIAVSRRAKYLLVHLDDQSTLLMHLGMSGTLRYFFDLPPYDRHDHVDIIFQNGGVLRFRDPRRFGVILHLAGNPLSHPLLSRLGPEPFSELFTAKYLCDLSRRKKIAVKTFLMDQRVVVGVGNIYASEALHAAGITPLLPAGEISFPRYLLLVNEVKNVLSRAIAAGGTTLRDFQSESGKPGYFAQELAVYGRAGEECRRCGNEIQSMRISGRSTFYCAECQR